MCTRIMGVYKKKQFFRFCLHKCTIGEPGAAAEPIFSTPTILIRGPASDAGLYYKAQFCVRARACVCLRGCFNSSTANGRPTMKLGAIDHQSSR